MTYGIRGEEELTKEKNTIKIKQAQNNVMPNNSVLLLNKPAAADLFINCLLIILLAKQQNNRTQFYFIKFKSLN